jgi:hypothetical protein
MIKPPAIAAISRFMNGILLRAAILLAILLAVMADPAGAKTANIEQVDSPDPRTYNPQLAAERRELLRILGRTKVCMFDATTAIRRQGERDDAAVRDFVRSMCGGAILPFLTGVSRWSREDANEFLDEMVRREVAASTSWGQK